MTLKRKKKNGERVWKEGDKERERMRARARERAMIKNIIPFYYTMGLQLRMPTGQQQQSYILCPLEGNHIFYTETYS